MIVIDWILTRAVTALIAKIVQIGESVIGKLRIWNLIHNVNKFGNLDSSDRDFGGSDLSQEVCPFGIMVGIRFVKFQIMEQRSSFGLGINMLNTINSLKLAINGTIDTSTEGTSKVMMVRDTLERCTWWLGQSKHEIQAKTLILSLNI